MLKKIILLIMVISTMVFVVSCRKKSDEITVEPTPAIQDILGLDRTSSPRGLYFDPLKDVLITNEKGESINHLLSVTGDVHYGEIGSYELVYKMTYGDQTIDRIRTIDIVDEPIVRTEYERDMAAAPFESLGEGSYRTGNATDIDHPVNPELINKDLLSKAIPSNSWWTSLLVANRGGGNGIYTNPLRAAFSAEGVEITNPGQGFVQHWNPDGYHTMANFSLALPDMFLFSSDLTGSYQTRVIGYGDSDVKVALRNPSDQRDHMVLTLAQGSPYVFVDVANTDSPHMTFPSGGVDDYRYFTVNGSPITESTHTDDGLIVKLEGKHVGYETYPPAQVGQPLYDDRYFLISVPEETTFDFSSSGHPRSLLNRLDLSLKEGNTFSIAAIDGLFEAPFYHSHAYVKTIDSDVSYTVNEATSTVHTTYRIATQAINQEQSSDPVQFLLPHHDENSTVTRLPYTFNTVRGELSLIEGDTFETELSFRGLVPALPLPSNDDFDDFQMASYLSELDHNTQIDDPDNFLNDAGPYWNGKASYPLAQGLISADQIGDDALKARFVAKLKGLLVDWLTYEGQSDDRYFYHNEAWGTVYDATNDFNTASELSDHRFTYGYMVYAAAILSMYDDAFKDDYGDMVRFVLDDYLYPYKDDEDKAYLRSFDPWAGHTWAHGFGTFAEGNNIESSSEAIHAWAAGYLWALETGDQDLRDAAIYGFVHEFAFAKTYIFDYQENIFAEEYAEYASVASIIWGGKYDYATWFGANPTFIYGIQWLPNGEYLSGYVETEADQSRLSDIYETYLAAKGGVIDTWYAQMWSIQAFLDPEASLSLFDAALIRQDDYPDDLAQSYYLIHGLASYGTRTTAYWMRLHESVTSSVYEDSKGVVRALIWNPGERTTVTFEHASQGIQTHTVEKRTLTSIVLA
jgi:endo-1,3(4)-beta-glucanase